ncbi:Phosphatidylinositol 4-phosphate 5-kinase its3 [Ceratocystis lukuohia]|uniref:Phosphatidylinositol 4-phosphate 5-kinase its3 n=1 Tax=Ceratocystis lukuohia TaxID=2019550 RepID=A0ABR4MH41_9PEZI
MPSYDTTFHQPDDASPMHHLHHHHFEPQSFANNQSETPNLTPASKPTLDHPQNHHEVISSPRHHHYDFPGTEYNDTSLHSASTPTPVDDRFDQSSVISSSRLSFTTTASTTEDIDQDPEQIRGLNRDHFLVQADLHNLPSRKPSVVSMSVSSVTASAPSMAPPPPPTSMAPPTSAPPPPPSLSSRMASLDLKSGNNRGSLETPIRPASLPAGSGVQPQDQRSVPGSGSGFAPASASASRLSATALRPEQPTSAPPPPPSSGLKHRHTLEVPKPQSTRTSRDSGDMAAYASGRFSPTAVPPPNITTTRRPSLSIGRRNTRSMQSDAPRDEIVVDDDARRWAEAVRQKRASKRRRKEEEDDDRVLVGTKVDEKHANWVTAYNMLTGIRVSVSRTNAKLDRQLTNADFDSKQKSTFDIAGNELVPSAKYDFKFKDYAPWVFRDLRKLFRLDPADYLMSLTGKYILSEMGSPGKSGSFFYYSRDYRYIIKTIHHGEHKFLRHILKDYYQHVKDNPNTLLSQFYGLHRVKTPFGKKIHFVVMNNIFPPHRDIHQTFDLKGSTIGRDYNEDDIKSNPRATLKDLNWMRRKRHLELGIQKKQLFMDQLQRDVKLLQRLHIMDYSLLVGIHDLSKGNDENLRDKTLQVFNPGGEHGVPGVMGDEGDDEMGIGGPGSNNNSSSINVGTGGGVGAGNDSNPSVLLRTPSKLESARKARELREMIRQERPIPMAQAASRMPEELDTSHRQHFLFNQDDGGFQATHEDNQPANEIYYLGVIDCLTKFGFIKKMEHFWKSLNNDRTKISAIPPEEYGERFFDFIENMTMSPEEAQREELRRQKEAESAALARANERSSTWGSRSRISSAAVPPMPTQAPPPPPPSGLSARRSVDAHLTSGAGEPANVLPPTKINEDTSLPVVHESGESSPARSGSRASRQQQTESMASQSQHEQYQQQQYRPRTPNASNATAAATAFMPGAPPPTPPKSDHHLNLKPDSADSGYYTAGGHPNNSHSHSGKLAVSATAAAPAPKPTPASIANTNTPAHSRSQASIDKELPSLPAGDAVVRSVYV